MPAADHQNGQCTQSGKEKSSLRGTGGQSISQHSQNCKDSDHPGPEPQIELRLARFCPYQSIGLKENTGQPQGGQEIDDVGMQPNRQPADLAPVRSDDLAQDEFQITRRQLVVAQAEQPPANIAPGSLNDLGKENIKSDRAQQNRQT